MKYKKKLRIQPENWRPLADEIPLSTPYLIFIDPSSKCNLQCKFCPNKIIKDKSVMSFSLYKKIIAQIKEFPEKIDTLRLYGFGEPLLCPSFTDMVKYARDLDVSNKIDTTTNATLLNPYFNLELAECGIDRINISVNGMSAKQYKNFSNYKIDFDKFVGNIGNLYSLVKGKTEIIIKLNGDYCSAEDCENFISLFSLISDGINIEHSMNCWPEFKVDNVNKKVGIYGQKPNEVKVCSYIFYQMTVHSDGKVSLCFLDYNNILSMGDVRKTKIKDIWESAMWNYWKFENLFGHREMLPVCKDCQQLKYGMPVNLDPYAEKILKRL